MTALRWLITGALGAAVAFLLWDFIVDGMMYDPLDGIKDKAAAVSKDESVEPRGYSVAYNAVIRKKNLFDSSRKDTPPSPQKPVAPKAQKPPEPPPVKPELKLKGIITDSFGDFVAYVEKDGSRAVALRVGDIIGEVEVLDVSERTIMLLWMDEKIELSMVKVKIIKR